MCQKCVHIEEAVITLPKRPPQNAAISKPGSRPGPTPAPKPKPGRAGGGPLGGQAPQGGPPKTPKMMFKMPYEPAKTQKWVFLPVFTVILYEKVRNPLFSIFTGKVIKKGGFISEKSAICPKF